MRQRVTLRLFSGLWVTILAGLLLAVDSIAAPGGGSSGFGGGGGGRGRRLLGRWRRSGSGAGGGSPIGLPDRHRRRLRVRGLRAAQGRAAAQAPPRARRARRARVGRGGRRRSLLRGRPVRAETAALHRAHRRRVDGPRPRRARPPSRARPAVRVGPPARRLRPQGLAQRLRDPQRPERRVPGPHQPRGRRRGPRRRPRRRLAARRRGRPQRQGHQAQRGGRRAHHARRVLDARPPGGRWILHSIEQDAEGAHHLDAPIVASPWSDDARLTTRR